MKTFIVALQFLTILPVKIRGTFDKRDIDRCIKVFPFIGVLQGAIAILTGSCSNRLLSPDITAFIITIMLFITNGGFHYDGLADTFDAFSVKKTGDKHSDIEKRLRIMRESTIGAIGVIVLVSVIFLKYLFIKNILIGSVRWDTFPFLLLVPVFSRWIMVPAMYHGKPARTEGLAKTLTDHVGNKTLFLASLFTAIITFSILPISGEPIMITAWFFFVSFISLYVLTLLWTMFCKSTFGGITGDTIGALSEVSEIIVLANILILVVHTSR